VLASGKEKGAQWPVRGIKGEPADYREATVARTAGSGLAGPMRLAERCWQ